MAAKGRHAVRVAGRVLAAACFTLALFIPVVVLILAALGAIEPHPYYPHPAAWPTIFASAFLLTIGGNIVVWLILTTRPGFSGSTAGIASALLILGSIAAVTVLAFVGIAIYFQLPVE